MEGLKLMQKKNFSGCTIHEAGLHVSIYGVSCLFGRDESSLLIVDREKTLGFGDSNPAPSLH